MLIKQIEQLVHLLLACQPVLPLLHSQLWQQALFQDQLGMLTRQAAAAAAVLLSQVPLVSSMLQPCASQVAASADSWATDR